MNSKLATKGNSNLFTFLLLLCELHVVASAGSSGSVVELQSVTMTRDDNDSETTWPSRIGRQLALRCDALFRALARNFPKG